MILELWPDGDSASQGIDGNLRFLVEVKFVAFLRDADRGQPPCRCPGRGDQRYDENARG